MNCPNCDHILNARGCSSCGWTRVDEFPAARLVAGSAFPLKDNLTYPEIPEHQKMLVNARGKTHEEMAIDRIGMKLAVEPEPDDDEGWVLRSDIRPPTLDEVLAAGYTKPVAQTIVAREQLAFKLREEPYGPHPRPLFEPGEAASVSEPADPVVEAKAPAAIEPSDEPVNAVLEPPAAPAEPSEEVMPTVSAEHNAGDTVAEPGVTEPTPDSGPTLAELQVKTDVQ